MKKRIVEIAFFVELFMILQTIALLYLILFMSVILNLFKNNIHFYIIVVSITDIVCHMYDDTTITIIYFCKLSTQYVLRPATFSVVILFLLGSYSLS